MRRQYGWLFGAAIVLLLLPLVMSKANRSDRSLLARATETIRRPFETVTIPAKGEVAAQKARLVVGSPDRPLIIDLPSWNGTAYSLSGKPEPLITAARRSGWSYLRPALAGPTHTQSGCCSEAALASLKVAVEYAQGATAVRPSYTVIVGESGGGYTALCSVLDGRLDVAAYLSFVPIVDLEAWHAKHANARTGSQIRACTGNKRELSTSEAQQRSPLYRPVARVELLDRLGIFAGIHDGINGSVDVSQSINMFNRLVSERGGSEIVDPVERAKLLRDRRGARHSDRTFGDRAVHLWRESGGLRLVLFEGAHEMPTEAALEEIERRLRSESGTAEKRPAR